MKKIISFTLLFFLLPLFSLAQNASPADELLGAPVAIALPVVGSSVAYGDLVSYDQPKNLYTVSQTANDAHVYGVVVEDPAIVIYQNQNDVPVARSGTVLVNVTLEGGLIAVGDALISSSIPGKAMKAQASSTNIIGYAREGFSSASTSTSLTLNGKPVLAGTIAVALAQALGSSPNAQETPHFGQIQCASGSFTCNVLQKIDATPLVTLMRYCIAAIVALGSLYLAFRSFMADAVNGVISVGRNPRAKGAIQAMVIFNAVLAGAIAIAGLAVGLLILFVRL